MKTTFLQQKRMRTRAHPNDDTETLFNHETIKKTIKIKPPEYSLLTIENVHYTSFSSKTLQESHSNNTIKISSELGLSNANNYNYGSSFHDCSSSINNNLLSNEERFFNHLFNPANIFNSYSTPSQFMSTTNCNNMLTPIEDSQVGNFIKMISSNTKNIIDYSTPGTQSQCFQDILNNKHREINHWTKQSKPSIFSICKISQKNISNSKIGLDQIKRLFYDNCLKIIEDMSSSLLFKEMEIEQFIEYYYTDDYQVNIIRRALEGIISMKVNLNDYFKENKKKKINHRNYYFMFSPEAKKFCLDLTDRNKIGLSIDIISKMCNVPRKSLKRWTIHGCSRKKGCGRKIREPLMELMLIEWYKKQVQENKYPSSMILRKKALSLSENKDFLASKGWLEKFKKKYNVKLSSAFRRKSTTQYYNSNSD